jgi:hypothetical protein
MVDGARAAPPSELAPAAAPDLATQGPARDPFAVAEARAASETVAAVSADLPGSGAGALFDGLTDEWRLSGRMLAAGSLRDILLRGQPVPIADVSWGSADGSSPMVAAPGLEQVDPDDFLVVISRENPPEGAGPGTGEAGILPSSVPGGWNVILDLGEVRVSGTAALPAGAGPERLLAEPGDRFLLLQRANILVSGTSITTEPVDVHVNRARVRAVRREAPGA